MDSSVLTPAGYGFMLASRHLPEDLDEKHEMADSTTNSEEKPSEDSLRAEYGEVSSNVR